MGSIEPDVQEARIGRSQPGVGLWNPHFFVLNFFKSGLTLNPHKKRNSFGLLIPLYLCCFVDCIKTVFISRCKSAMDQRSVTIHRINDYERALQLIGYMSEDSDENANDSSEIDSVFDSATVGDVSALSEVENMVKSHNPGANTGVNLGICCQKCNCFSI